MQQSVAAQLVHRVLDPVSKDVFFTSSDPGDPRLGNLVEQSLNDITSAQTTVVVVGMPQDVGVARNNGRIGAAAAPMAIRRSLYKMATSAIDHAFMTNQLRIVDAGNIRTEGRSLEQMHDDLHDVVAALLQANAWPIVIGGGHDTAWPTLKAYETVRKQYGVINIDAHADVRPLKEDGKAHSGSPFRQMLEVPDSCRVEHGFVEFGLQEHAVATAHLDFVRQHGGEVYMLDEANNEGAWQKACAWVSNAELLHVSLDMDAFASAYAPGVSAPAADGFTPAFVGACLNEVARSPRCTSFDVVEVNPTYDVDGRTSKLAATMIMHVLAGIAKRNS